MLESAPTGALDARSPSLENKESINHLRAAAKEARRLQLQGAELSARFDLGVGSPDELERHAGVIDQTPWFKRLFSGDYRTAIKSYTAMAKDHKRAARDAMCGAFKSVAAYQSQRRAFGDNAAHRERIGVGFVGLESNWDALLKLADWYEAVFLAFPEGAPSAAAFRAALFTEDTRRE